MKNSSTISTPLFLSSDKEVSTLRDAHPELVEVDAFERQLKELFLVENAHLAGDKQAALASEQFKKYVHKKAHAYVYVYYPWNNFLVKTVRANDYFTLKTNRNRDLITETEQKKLGTYTIAVFGMSVGSNVAFMATQAGISREIIIADFDDLDTTNLNRILGGAHQIGLHKCILAARRIYEDNPFAKVTLLKNGITEKKLEALLVKKKVDCIVDEVDAIPMKLTMRQLALKHKVPVLMITDNGDGIVLHIERYDLGYKKILHHTSTYWQKKLQQLAKNPRDRKKLMGGMIMDDIVGGAHLTDPKMITSVKQVLDGTLVSWSQLGSAAMLGGVYATYALKKIILGKEVRKEVRVHINPHF